MGQSSSSYCWSAGCWFWHPAPGRVALLHLLWKGVWPSRVLKMLCFWADFLSNQPFPERVTLTRMWIIIEIDTVVSEWLTPGGGIMEEGKEFACYLLLHVCFTLYHSHSLICYILLVLGLTSGSFFFSATLFAFKKRKQDVVWQSTQNNVKLAGSPVSGTSKLNFYSQKTLSLDDKIVKHVCCLLF